MQLRWGKTNSYKIFVCISVGWVRRTHIILYHSSYSSLLILLLFFLPLPLSLHGFVFLISHSNILQYLHAPNLDLLQLFCFIFQSQMSLHPFHTLIASDHCNRHVGNTASFIFHKGQIPLGNIFLVYLMEAIPMCYELIK